MVFWVRGKRGKGKGLTGFDQSQWFDPGLITLGLGGLVFIGLGQKGWAGFLGYWIWFRSSIILG